MSILHTPNNRAPTLLWSDAGPIMDSHARKKRKETIFGRKKIPFEYILPSPRSGAPLIVHLRNYLGGLKQERSGPPPLVSSVGWLDGSPGLDHGAGLLGHDHGVGEVRDKLLLKPPGGGGIRPNPPPPGSGVLKIGFKIDLTVAEDPLTQPPPSPGGPGLPS